MKVPRIEIKATNVELSEQLQHQVRQRLSPLTRVFRSEDMAVVVQIRKAQTEFGGAIHFVSLRLTINGETTTAVAAKPYLSRALGVAVDTLRRSISRGASVSPLQATNFAALKESYTLTL
ncbi:MAG: HPF/RaiA family ribosome-associated protein [Candidatus Paceibacterota bacterium]